MSTDKNNSGGIGLFGALTILFVALKLLHKITWSWWWVLLPTWGVFALAIVVALAVLLYEWRH